MLIGKFEKQPVEIKDYVIDLSEWLGAVNDSLSNANVSVACLDAIDEPETALRLKELNVGLATGSVAVWLERGTDGKRYKVTVTAFTVAGRVDQSEFVIKIKEI